MKIKLNTTADALIRKYGLEPGGKVQKYIDMQVVRECEPYVPYRTGVLAGSAANSRFGSGSVTYTAPYARRVYYATRFRFRKDYHPKATAGWFAAMCRAGGVIRILSGAAKAAGAKSWKTRWSK